MTSHLQEHNHATPGVAPVTQDQMRQFDELGYVAVDGILDPEQDLQPL